MGSMAWTIRLRMRHASHRHHPRLHGSIVIRWMSVYGDKCVQEEGGGGDKVGVTGKKTVEGKGKQEVQGGKGKALHAGIPYDLFHSFLYRANLSSYREVSIYTCFVEYPWTQIKMRLRHGLTQ